MMMQDVLGLILGGGQGTRLYPLTKKRSKPAQPARQRNGELGRTGRFGRGAQDGGYPG